MKAAFLALLVLLLRVQAAETDYTSVGVLIDQFVTREMRDKQIDGAAVALVEDQRIVWSRGFGVSKIEKMSTADESAVGSSMSDKTVIRAGSVSKLFTAVLVMREVEKGRLSLDEPIQKYLPKFAPTNRFDKPVTLRHILSHHSGIVREPPYGNYFEPEQDNLSKMVESLNGTEIIYEPGERTKYSNAAIATAGYLVSLSAEQSYARLARNSIFKPLSMTSSAFELEKTLRKEMADGVMWTLHGTKFKAPVFEWGMSPAASLNTTVIDLGRFASALFGDANGAGKLLKKETLESMWKPQFTEGKRGFGLGFSMSEFDGHRRASHGGAVYGFATDFSILPDQKLGAVVVVTRDFANTVSSRISALALRGMLAAREGKALPIPAETKALTAEQVRDWKGKFVAGDKSFELVDFDGKLHLMRDTMPAALRMSDEKFMADGLTAYGMTIEPGETKDQIKLNGETYYRAISKAPPAPPAKWRDFIGEYGWDYDVLYFFEKDGQLWTLIEWFEFAPLTEVAPDIFKFPDYGSYAGEKIVFKRDKQGRVSEAVTASIAFKRRKVGMDDTTGQARIRPQKPIPDLLKKAWMESPPKERGEFKTPELVDLPSLDQSLTLEIRYATTNNFLGSVFYPEPRAFLQRPAAEALVRASAKLRAKGFGLRIFDAYRPWAVTKVFWDATTEAQHEFVADPSKGSRHNRGCAVDVTLYDLATGNSVEMTGTYDETTDRSYPTYPGGTSQQRWHRELLREAMESEGFTVYYTEWWHFDYNGWRSYPIQNVPFDQIR